MADVANVSQNACCCTSLRLLAPCCLTIQHKQVAPEYYTGSMTVHATHLRPGNGLWTFGLDLHRSLFQPQDHKLAEAARC